MEILQENKCEAEVVKYLEEKPDVKKIKAILKMLGIAPKELMRTKEDIYKELKLMDETDDEALIEAMAHNPKLIERPIIIKGDRAIIGRPAEKIAEFLNS
jgi:arsenate reductase